MGGFLTLEPDYILDDYEIFTSDHVAVYYDNELKDPNFSWSTFSGSWALKQEDTKFIFSNAYSFRENQLEAQIVSLDEKQLKLVFVEGIAANYLVYKAVP